MTNRLDEVWINFHAMSTYDQQKDVFKKALSALVEEIIGGLEPDYIAVERDKRVDEAILRKELYLRELRNGVRKQQIERANKLGFSL